MLKFAAMSRKRNATRELNHDNWNQEEEDENPGTFEPLPSAELKNRIIKKAVRKTKTNSESNNPSPFSAFSGFQSSSNSPFAQKSASSPFLGLFKKEDGKTNGDPPKKDPEPPASTPKIEVSSQKVVADTPVNPSENKQIQPRSMDYYVQLRSLNESVLKWMQLHLNKNACCDFTPVFNDYKKYMDTLAVNYPVIVQDTDSSEGKSSAATVENPVTTTPTQEAPKETADSSLTKEDKTDYGAHFSSNTTNTSTFSFGIKLTPTATSGSKGGPTSSSKENEAEEKKEASTGFSFGLKNTQWGSSGFSFATAPVGDSSAPAAGEEEYVPPKNEVNAVVEEGAIYSKRCKLFFKKDGSFADKGVGTLHLKKIDDKTQLLVRADTNLGNILLNIGLNSSLPMSRTGKNNVLIACIPNPPVDPKKPDSKETVPILIRVKTTEDADELLEKLNEHKS